MIMYRYIHMFTLKSLGLHEAENEIEKLGPHHGRTFVGLPMSSYHNFGEL
jgi:hypothetical protein